MSSPPPIRLLIAVATTALVLIILGAAGRAEGAVEFLGWGLFFFFAQLGALLAERAPARRCLRVPRG